MSDINSGLPIRTQLPGQANYDDVVVKLGDATTPAQQAKVDTFGSQQSTIADAAGNLITSVTNGAVQALEVQAQTAGPVTPGTAAAFSDLIGGQYNSSLPTLTTGQQSAIQVDANGRILVSNSNFPTTVDTNYGTVGANTIRTAAQIGNATGAADFNAGATGAQTLRVSANQGAPNTVANAWPMLITDGTHTATVSAGGDLNVTVATALPAGSNNIGSVNQGTSPWITSDLADGSVTGGTAGTKSMLGGGIYNSTPPTLTNGQQASLQLNAAGALIVSATFSEDTNYGTVGANTLRTAAQIGNATGAADFNFGTVGAQTLRVAAEPGNATGIADFNNGATSAQTLRVAANLAVAGANVSATNPVPVSFSSAPLGTPVNNYNTVAAVAAAATSNHIYTITSAKTFQGKKIWASASGLMKIEVRVSPDGSTYSTLWVGFNSTADANITIDMDQMVFLESGAGATIEVIRTNMDKKAMDVYSTISGTEV